MSRPCPHGDACHSVDPRTFVEPESISWEIDEICKRAWEEDGERLAYAHIMKTVTDQYQRKFHQPVCGAQVGHHEQYCVTAPGGYPKCRKCSTKIDHGLPGAFAKAFAQEI